MEEEDTSIERRMNFLGCGLPTSPTWIAQLRSSLPGKTLLVLNEMRSRREFCDVILKTEDGTEIPAHRNIICAGSKYFSVLFTTYRKDYGETVIVKNISGSILKQVVDYLYSSDTTFPGHQVEALLEAADFLQTELLRDDLCEYISANINLDNWFEIYTLFMTYGCRNRLSDWYFYVLEMFHSIGNTEKFFNLPLEDAIDFLSSDSACVPYEETIYQSAINWIKKDLDNRRQYLPKVMKRIRFHLVGKTFAMDLLANESLIRDSTECYEMVREGLSIILSKDDDGSIRRPRCWSPAKTIFVIGGVTENGETTDDIGLFSPFRKTWHSWPIMSNMSDKWGAGLIFIDKSLYSFGGVENDGLTHMLTVFNIERIHQRVRNQPVFINVRASVVSVENRIFVVGGQDIISDDEFTLYSKTMKAYDVRGKSWSSYSDMGTERSCACAVQMDNFIYVIGGYSYDTGYLQTAERFNILEDRWSPVRSMKYPRRGASAAVLQNKIFVAGGYMSESQVSKTVEMFDPETGVWSLISEMCMPRAYGGLCADEEENCLYYFGGKCEHDTYDSIECYSFTTNEWIILGERMNKAKHSFGITMGEKVFYANSVPFNPTIEET